MYSIATGTPWFCSTAVRPFQNGMTTISSRLKAFSAASVFSMMTASFFFTSCARKAMPGSTLSSLPPSVLFNTCSQELPTQP
jgi:hypothetical protein